jgi:hypothetical protein
VHSHPPFFRTHWRPVAAPSQSQPLLSLAGLVNLKKVKLFSSQIKKIKEYIVHAFCAHALADTSRAGGRQKATRYTLFLSFGIA